MKRSPPGLIYTILIDGNPVVALEANAREAAELCREEWFRADLCTLSSDGKPLCGLGSKLQARPATEDERSEYSEGSKEADPSDDILFGQSRSSSAMKSLPGHKRDTQPCRMPDLIGSRCCDQHGLC